MIGETRITLKNLKKQVGVRWMPASIESNFPGIVSTKYGRFSKLARKVKKFGKLSGHYWQFYDRQIRVSYSPLPDSWGDETVDLTVFGKNTRFETDFAMINTFKSTESMSKVKNALQGNYIVVGDSGGFQIVSEITKFIHPKKIIQLGESLVDVQICLDLPPGGVADQGILRKSARVLALNNKLFEKHRKKESTLLMNVSHGNSIKLRKMWIDTVLNEGPTFDGLAVGGLQSNISDGLGPLYIHPLEFVKHALFILDYTKDVYHYYHFLGVAADWQIAILNVLAKRFGKLITVDSSSHIQMSNYGFFKLAGPTDKIGMPEKHKWNLDRIPCTCPFCTPYCYKEIFISKSNCMQGHNTEAISRLPFLYDAWYNSMPLDAFCDKIIAPLTQLAGQAFKAAVNGSPKNIDHDDSALKHSRKVHEPPSLFGNDKKKITQQKHSRYAAIVDSYLQFHGKAK